MQRHKGTKGIIVFLLCAFASLTLNEEFLWMKE